MRTGLISLPKKATPAIEAATIAPTTQSSQ